MGGYEGTQVRNIVEHAVRHTWSVPEFQRGFVWKAVQVKDLIESLWLGYPVGTLLVWDSAGPVQTRSAPDGSPPTKWVVDGQQRTTAFCILSGRKPYWWDEKKQWDSILRKYDIRFDIHTRDAPYFVIANAATRKVKGSRYIPVGDVLNLDTARDDDQKKLMQLARQIKLEGLCDGMDAMEVYTRLDRVRKIRDAEVVVITVDNDLEDVVEIFARLNSKGTRVREADIYLGIVAARNPGWVRASFLPFVSDLEDSGFEISPNIVFRALTAVGCGRIIFKTVPDDFWSPATIERAWERTKAAWSLAVKQLKTRGIAGNALLPSDNVLVTLVAFLDKFPDARFEPAFYWMLQALRFGRYSGSTTTALDEDLREIVGATTPAAALEALLDRLRYVAPLDASDFLRDYSETRFGRTLMYLLAHNNGAYDWDDRALKIGFDGSDLLAGFEPQFHHVFPRKFLAGATEPALIDALANIAVIGPAINIRISKQNPMDYVPKYKITPEKLAQQHIGRDIGTTPKEAFPEWVQARAKVLAAESNRYLDGLRGQLRLPASVADAESIEHAYDAA